MTQKIFDIENEKDMADLWDIVPDGVVRIIFIDKDIIHIEFKEYKTISTLFKINWHDKTEITRPIQEATEADIGKLCYFWTGKDFAIGILEIIGDKSSLDVYCMKDGKSGIWFAHCRRLTEQEIEELI